MTSSRPPMIRTDASNAFAHDTMKVRVPATIREVQRLNPDYPHSIQQALARLAGDIAGNRPMAMIDAPAPDYESWAEAYHQHEGDTWLNTVWFFAETFFYRHLTQGVRCWETGRDPFAPQKTAELANPDLWALVERALGLRDEPAETRLIALLHAALWGNRIDLSLPTSLAHGSTGSASDILVDDSAAAARHLANTRGDVHIIADNAGTELAMDLMLVEALLDHTAERVVLHVKMHPTFVSDATVADVWALIGAMTTQGRSAEIARCCARLRAAVDSGRVQLAPDFFWNSSRLLWEMPSYLAAAFRGAALVVVKGDANYRRMVGDAIWPPETPFAGVTAYFPVPLLALRTLKSDPIVGLPAGLAAQLDSVDSDWRTNGQRGVIQFRAVA